MSTAHVQTFLAARPEARARARTCARTADRLSLFDTVSLDILLVPEVTWTPEALQGPDLLSFAGIELVTVPGIPLEEHVSEKLHAYVRDYTGRPSTRVKDLVDLALIASSTSIDSERLASAIDVTF